MEAKDPFAILWDKLQAPHPLLQRVAVSSIFQRFAAAPDAALMMSQAGSGKEALVRCLASQNPCIVDQSVRELCKIAKSGGISLGQAVMILQASLDSVTSSISLHVLVCGIGFLCRLHVAGHDNSITVHPLLKALQSREETSSSIIQQVRLVLLHASDHQRAMQFIQPFLTRVFLDPSRMRSSFARGLHSNLCAIAISRPCLAPGLMKLLIQYAQSRFLETPQDIEFLCEGIQELMDLLEESSHFSEMEDFTSPILELLFGLWHESKTHSLPSLPFVCLVRRISLLPSKPQRLDVYLASLAYLLAISELEQEQLSILALAQTWLEKDSNFTLQSLLFWIFPTLHILTSPSSLLKQAATSLLKKIDRLLSDGSLLNVKAGKSESMQLGGLAYELLCSLWTKEADVEAWFKTLTTHLSDSDFPMLLAILTTALTFHPSSKISGFAINMLALLGQHHAVWGISLFPVFLFSLKYHQRHDVNTNVVIAFLNALPDICGHPTTVPLSMHLLQHMVDYKENLRIQATSIRLIYKIWQHTDRAYSFLQKTLVPSWFSQAKEETDVLLSRATSLRDLCGHDPDVGIELILSVQACVECRSPVVKALGLQSLSFLCGHDAIDFYTAWKVIAKLFSPLPVSPSISESFCMLLKHGALDANLNAEDAHAVLNALWEFSSCDKQPSEEWYRTRSAAVESLCEYEVELLKETMVNEGKHVDILLRGASTAAKYQCERLVAKFLDYEHNTRQRATTEKVIMSKLEKMLESIPRTFTSSTQNDYPGSLLFFWNASRGSLATAKKSALRVEEEGLKSVFFEVAKTLNVSGDLIMVLISLFSWSCFMHQWLKLGCQLHGNAEVACEHIVKACIDASEEGIPRVSENSTLALAAFSRSLRQPSLASSSVARYLESRISSLEHQSAQCSAAVSLGVLTTSLHPTDWDVKANAVRLLIQSATEADNAFVVGSAATGLGIACQSLFLSEFSSMGSSKECALLSDIVHCVLKLLALRCPQIFSTMLALSQDSFFTTEVFTQETNVKDSRNEEDDLWAIVGLVWALGKSVTPLGKAGKTTLVKRITQAVFSWIPDSIDEVGTMCLATGASLVLPTCVEASDRLELLELAEIESLLSRLGSFVRQIVDLPQSKRSSQPWLAHVFKASCIGYGGLVAKVLQTGAHPLAQETVRDLLETLHRGYTQVEDAHYCLGAMLGLANALGAGVASEFEPQGAEQHVVSSLQAGNKVTTPLMFSSAHGGTLRTMLQQIVRISHSSEGGRLRGYARWCLAIMHTAWLRVSQGRVSAEGSERPTRATVRWSYQPVSLSSLPAHSTLRLLSEWLSSIGLTKVGIPCDEVISVMRCLEEAPRLPMLDWGGLIRRIMQHKEWFLQPSSGPDHGDVRNRCLIFSFRHADKVPPLASVLDEVCEGSKLVTIETSLRTVVLSRLGDLHKIFSLARMEKLLVDVIQVLGKLQTDARECRVECWKGLAKFWATDTRDLLVHIESCMRQLISMSPARFIDHNDTEETERDTMEWSVALECLKHARTSWLLDVFKIQDESFGKVAFARSRLAAMKVLPLSSLKVVRSRLLDRQITGHWMLMTECALALKDAQFEDKHEWLLDTIDTAYVSKFPSTAISFMALLTSIWSPDSYLFTLSEPQIVRQLPHSLQKLLAEKKWNQSARVVASRLFSVMERVAKLGGSMEEGNVGEELIGAVESAAISIREHATPDLLAKVRMSTN
ncbi:protein RST1 [Selaginella moellendorffii]|uniref:protein RST1 n=1 Tax=Selaginella moellendorffii TaxID=88036 RepID=UPI000D1C6C1D|nr:protein RST1 [Selaginella moellendorffii]|eukprot:XP_024518081.1 protein RST1 [Selaginella moellendorffii]